MSFFGDLIPAVHFPCGLDCQHVTFRASLRSPSSSLSCLLRRALILSSHQDLRSASPTAFLIPPLPPAAPGPHSLLPQPGPLAHHRGNPPEYILNSLLAWKKIKPDPSISSPTSLCLDSLPMMQCVYQSLNFSRYAFGPWPSSLLKFLLPIINLLFSAAPFP